jgi:hypothetical protein
VGIYTGLEVLMVIRHIVASALLSASLWPVAAAQAPNTSIRELETVTGTVERTERATRTVTLRTGPSTTHMVSVPPENTIFDELRTGDRITVRLSESVVVAVRPGGKPSLPVETTGNASRVPSAARDVVQQMKAAVTIESLDRGQNVIVYRTADNQRGTRRVLDPRLLDGLKAGDVIEVTYTQERAVDIQRAR